MCLGCGWAGVLAIMGLLSQSCNHDGRHSVDWWVSEMNDLQFEEAEESGSNGLG